MDWFIEIHGHRICVNSGSVMLPEVSCSHMRIVWSIAIPLNTWRSPMITSKVKVVFGEDFKLMSDFHKRSAVQRAHMVPLAKKNK